jgi:iron(III) transport system ATP-binding protein
MSANTRHLGGSGKLLICFAAMVQVSIEHVTKRFPAPRRRKDGATVAVDDVSLVVPSGSLFFLLGPSGCGKTTLLRMVAGFAMPDQGRIRFDDRDMSTVPPHLRDTGMVFQSYALWPHMTVADNVAFGLDVRRMAKPDRARRIEEVLALVQMAHLADRKPAQLSGGQQQRVALARALAIRPKCLLLDEPLSNLDAKLRLEMRSEIRRIVKQTGITALYVTHDQKEALSMADAIAVMNSGKLEQIGTPEQLYRRPASRFVAGFLGESNFLQASVESVNASLLTLQTPAGPVIAPVAAAPPGPPPRAGQRLCIAFRPEAVAVRTQGAERSGANTTRIPARHLATTYLGEMAEHLLQLPGDLQVKAYQMNPRTTPVLHQEVTLEIAPVDLMLIPET